MISLLPETNTSKYNPLICCDLKAKGKDLEYQAWKLELITKISYLAIAAISAVTIVIPFIVTTMTYTISFALFGCIALTPVLTWKCSELERERLSLSSQVTETLEILKKEHTLKPTVLKDYKSELSFEALKPAIAFHKYYLEKSEKLTQVAHNAIKGCKNIEAAPIRHAQLYYAWNCIEQEILPAKINAAFALHVIRNPTFEGTPSTYFQYTQKSFGGREADKFVGYGDTYLISKKDPKIQFSFEILEKSDDIEKLRRMLFEECLGKFNNLTLGPKSF